MENNNRNKIKSIEVRRSTFIYSSGPGAIIEGLSGFSRIVPLIQTGLGRLWSKDTLERSRINNYKLENLIKQYTQCTNPAIMEIPADITYHTKKFPSWRICYNTSEHEESGISKMPILYNTENCPVCHKNSASSSVRFVMACPQGHLSDIDWKYAVHRKSKCDGDYYIWNSGRTLSNIEIECNKCHSKTTMGNIYHLQFFCSGQFPEREDGMKKCNEKMQVMQKNATSLYLPKPILLLRTDGNNDLIVAFKGIRQYILTFQARMINSDLNELKQELRHLIDDDSEIQPNNKTILLQYIDKHNLNEIFEFNKFIDNEKNKKFIDYVYGEFDYLNKNADIAKSYEVSMNNSVTLRVSPVPSLKVDTVNIGYIRMVDNNNQHMVDIGSNLQGTDTVYPGIENPGEGLLITTESFPDLKRYSNLWKIDANNNFVSEMWEPAISPEFVWLHTLSHAIMLEISLLDGYSTGSVRERIYKNPDSKIGGILFYTSVYGNGAMGGLSGIIKKDMEIIIKKAILRINTCSNDPICINESKHSGKENGAACFSCVMVPETSCEQANRYLDRHILLGN